MPLPVTINVVVQQKIKEMNITQGKLAEMFGMGSAKISQILSGKREPDVSFLKAVHEKLGLMAILFLNWYKLFIIFSRTGNYFKSKNVVPLIQYINTFGFINK